MPKPTGPGTKQRSSSRLGPYASTVGLGDATTPLVGSNRRSWSKLPTLLLLGASFWLLVALFSDSRFRVGHVEIEGANLLAESEVMALITVRGRSAFHVRTDEIEALLLDEFGCVEEASVICRLPNTVRVKLRERENLLVWESSEQYWWVDEGGDVLGATRDPGDLVVIHDRADWARQPGEHIIGVPWAFAEELMVAMPSVRDYDYVRAQGLTLYLTDKRWPVFLGHRGPAQEKVAIMHALLEQLGTVGADVEYVDLRSARFPTYKLK